MSQARLSYCAEQVRRQDRDRYLTALFAPAGRREELFALYAFNLEVARTAEVVSESLIGRMRLQWWREAIAEIYEGRARAHAVVDPLAAAVARRNLSRGHFERLIDAREADLDGVAPAGLDALEAYADATSAGLLRLALEVLGAPAEEGPAAEAVGHLGVAWALTGLARAVPFHARQKRLYLPAELTVEAGLAEQALFELGSSPALAQVVEQVAGRARARLRAARVRQRELPRAAKPVLLFAPLADRYLDELERAGFDPFDPRVQAPATGAPWRLLWASLRRRY